MVNINKVVIFIKKSKDFENDVKVEENISFSDKLQSKYKDLKSTKTIYTSIIYYLLVVCSMTLVLFWVVNTSQIENVKNIIQLINVKSIVLIVIVCLLIVVMKSLKLFLTTYSKTKSKKFARCYGFVVESEFYSGVTVNQRGRDISLIGGLLNKKTKNNIAINSVYGINIVNKIALISYFVVMLMLGLILNVKMVNLWLLLIAIIYILYNLLFVIFVFYAKKNKKSAIVFVGKLCKLLYKLKIIKDYEKVFSCMTDKLLYYTKSVENNKILNIVNFCGEIICLMLKSIVLFLVVNMLGATNDFDIILIMFNILVLDCCLGVIPIPNGIFVFEILFMVVFSNVFLNGYLFWVLLIYRLIITMFPLLHLIVVELIRGIVNKITMHKQKKRVV